MSWKGLLLAGIWRKREKEVVEDESKNVVDEGDEGTHFGRIFWLVISQLWTFDAAAGVAVAPVSVSVASRGTSTHS